MQTVQSLSTAIDMVIFESWSAQPDRTREENKHKDGKEKRASIVRSAAIQPYALKAEIF
jgi:hypothetical protein